MNPIYAPARPTVRTGHDVARGLGAALALVVFVVGVPLVLVVVAPLSWPQSWPTGASLQMMLTRPDDGALLLGVIRVLAWVAWAVFSASVLVEVMAGIRHVQAPSIPMLRWVQRGAATLVTTAGLLLSTAAPTFASGGVPVIAAAPMLVDAAPSTVMTGSAPTMMGTPQPMTTSSGTMTSAPTRMPGERSTSGTHAEADRHPVVTVTRGDTLWSLAERHLGSGHRYSEIRDLNLGRTQPDGAALTDAHWIYPGWQLRLPTDATGSPAPSPASASATEAPQLPATHEVVTGDTLWDVATDHLGDGARYPEIYDLNVGVLQPDGHTMTDPDLIQPGWHLSLSTAAQSARLTPTAEAVAAPAAPEPEDPVPGHDEPETARSTTPRHAAIAQPPRGADLLENPAADADAAAGEADDSVPAGQLFLGLTGLAAVGVVGELARRRHLQHRTRRTGERIPLPEPGSPTDQAERTLRTARTPLSVPQLKTALLNLATRAYAAERDLPRIGTLVLSDQTLELHLTEDDRAPLAPFTAVDDCTWSASTATLASDTVEDDPDRPEPYPALVTVGHTDDATVIVNLEAAGTLSFTGDSTAAHDVLRAIITELATSDLAGRVGLITGREFAGLAATCDPARLQCVEPAVLVSQRTDRSDAVARVLRSAGVDDTLEARSDRTSDDTWIPVLYVDTHAAKEWTPPAPWSGSVLLTTSTLPTAWNLTVSAEGRTLLRPAHLELKPQRLTDTDLDHLVTLLTTAEPAVDDTRDTRARELSEEISEALAVLPVTAAPPEPDHAVRSGTPPLRINVLGPIEILGLPDGARPLGKRSTELLVYLALRGKATGPELDEVLWHGRRVDNQARNSLIYRTRQRVGVSNLPPVDADGHYRLGARVTCDWTSFQQLVRHGYAAGADGRDKLDDALGLVRDRPLSGLRGADYAWAENDTQEMISAIADAAHALSASLLTLGAHRRALSAATQGLLAEPCSELLYEDAIEAARQRGDALEAARLRSRLRAQLESLDPEYVG